MKQKRILSWVIVFVMLFAMAVPTKKAYASTSNVLGGQTSNGSLNVTVNDGGINVTRYNGSAFQNQYYSVSGAVLDVNGTIYKIGGYNNYNTPNTATFESQTADGNSVTTVWNAGSIEVSQKVTLPSLNSQYIKLDWSFTNTSDSTIDNIHFLRGIDTYLSGGDTGSGFWDNSTNTIGVTKTIDGVTQKLFMQGITAPNSYASKYYDSVDGEVSDGGTLSDEVDSDAGTDNGYALEWTTSSLSANSTWNVRAIESFIASSITASADNKTTTGAAVNLTFNMTNSSTNPQNLSYSITAPDGWTFELERESDVISAGSTVPLNVLVRPSVAALNGVYDVILNISANGLDSQIICSVTVNSVTTTPTTVEITRDDDILTAELKDVDGNNINTPPTVTYNWYSDSDLVQSSTNNTYTLTNADKGTSITVKVEQYNLESEPLYIAEDEIKATTPAAVEITRNDNTIISQLIDKDGNNVTTGPAVTYAWYRDNELIPSEIGKTYTISNDDKGKSIKLIVTYGEAELISNVITIGNDEPESTSILLATGSLGTAGDNKVTGLRSGHRYKVIVDGKAYYVKADGTLSIYKADASYLLGTEIVGLVNGKTYYVQEFSNSSSSSSSSSSGSSNKSTTENITVNVTDGSSDNSISKTVIVRTTLSDGTKKDTVTYTPDKARETIEALLAEGKSIARIVAKNKETAVSETRVNIPKNTLSVLSSGNVGLEIETDGAIVSVPKESVRDLYNNGQFNEDLYFRLVPIKNQAKQQEIESTANKEMSIRIISGKDGIKVLGKPMTIETNMSKTSVDIILPLTGVTLPSDPAERDAFLKDLGVFIEHSDGEKVLQKGEIVEYAPGVYGIKFTVNKFSNFTIVKLNQEAKVGWKQTNGVWYFVKNDGTMQTGWFKDADGSWYFLRDNKDVGPLGVMEKGWKLINGTWYLLKDSGAMATDWQQVNGVWYYLNSDGSMASNTTIEGYTLDSNGAWIE